MTTHKPSLIEVLTLDVGPVDVVRRSIDETVQTANCGHDHTVSHSSTLVHNFFLGRYLDWWKYDRTFDFRYSRLSNVLQRLTVVRYKVAPNVVLIDVYKINKRL